MGKGFYFRLACANVKRSREVYLPYFLATAIIGGVYFLILAMIFSPGLTNLPGGETARAVFTAGIVVFSIFAFMFMLYINAFLIKRRKKEFGLYSVLGMGRRQVARVLKWENLLVVGAGVIAGVLLGTVVGRLLFLLLMNMLHAVAGSTFQVPFFAYLGTLALFTAVFLTTSIYNGIRVRVADTAELLKSDRQGEKNPKAVVPVAILGTLLLGFAYFIALTTTNMGTALGLFFPAAMVVIIATYMLFHAGSIAFLRLLRRNKRLYYKPENFIAISGMFHRMRQNARGLATICVLSTMLIVTVAGTCSLYLGQEEILRENYPYDIRASFYNEEQQVDLQALDQKLAALSARHNVTLAGSPEKLTDEAHAPRSNPGRIVQREASEFVQLENAVFLDDTLMLDVAGTEENCTAFAAALSETLYTDYEVHIADVFSARVEGYAIYGGLLFLGAFFAVLFLSVAVLMIYFKQVTEGQEDKERFSIMQQVGMQDTEVKKTIDKQILWVFFLPLFGALVHVLAASKMIAKMLESFMLFNTGLTLSCILVTSAVFAIVYLAVYRQTARVYYRIVKR